MRLRASSLAQSSGLEKLETQKMHHILGCLHLNLVIPQMGLAVAQHYKIDDKALPSILVLFSLVHLQLKRRVPFESQGLWCQHEVPRLGSHEM